MLNYYPPVDPAKLKSTQWSFSPHTDYTAFTVLLQDSSGGLQARNSAGDWIDVPPKKGTFVVNVGNLLARWTNDLYTSTLHRALHVGASPRISGHFSFTPTTGPSCAASIPAKDRTIRRVMRPVVTEDYVRVLREDAQRSGRPASRSIPLSASRIHSQNLRKTPSGSAYERGTKNRSALERCVLDDISGMAVHRFCAGAFLRCQWS